MCLSPLVPSLLDLSAVCLWADSTPTEEDLIIWMHTVQYLIILFFDTSSLVLAKQNPWKTKISFPKLLQYVWTSIIFKLQRYSLQFSKGHYFLYVLSFWKNPDHFISQVDEIFSQKGSQLHNWMSKFLMFIFLVRMNFLWSDSKHLRKGIILLYLKTPLHKRMWSLDS